MHLLADMLHVAAELRPILFQLVLFHCHTTRPAGRLMLMSFIVQDRYCGPRGNLLTWLISFVSFLMLGCESCFLNRVWGFRVCTGLKGIV